MMPIYSRLATSGLRLVCYSGVRRRHPVSRYSTVVSTMATHSADRGRDFQIPVPWGHIAAKEWGDVGGRPIMALHGLGDNLATFERLVPLLPNNWHIVAIDFPGFGLSSPLPDGAFPSVFSLSADTMRVLNYIGWTTCDMIGHSMGGAVALFYAALFPDQVGRLVGLDTAKFLCGSAAQVHNILAQKIKLMLETEAKRREKTFDVLPLDVAINRLISKSKNSLTEESAMILLNRIAVGGAPGAREMITIPREPRNRLIASQDFTVEQGFATADTLGRNVDILLIKPNNGDIPKFAQDMDDLPLVDYISAIGCHGRLTQVNVEGTHHVHLNHPERVLRPLVNYLETANQLPITQSSKGREVAINEFDDKRTEKQNADTV